VFDQRAVLPYWRRHPVLSAAALALGYVALMHGWYAPVAVVAGWAALVSARRRWRKAAQRHAALRARADYEHRLSLVGDPRGLYGRFPPVQAGWFPDPGRKTQWRYFDGAFWTGHVAPR
jgi:hypothetical protein